jgi:hypothetical protein
VWGVPNCGKGQPYQNGRVSHGAAPGRFRDVHVGVTGSGGLRASPPVNGGSGAHG